MWLQVTLLVLNLFQKDTRDDLIHLLVRTGKTPVGQRETEPPAGHGAGVKEPEPQLAPRCAEPSGDKAGPCLSQQRGEKEPVAANSAPLDPF